MERSKFSSTHLEGEIKTIVTVGIDLAKNVFAVHGVDEPGNPMLVRPEVTRAKLLELIAHLPPCLVASWPRGLNSKLNESNSSKFRVK
jgi:hypothetical protein